MKDYPSTSSSSSSAVMNRSSTSQANREQTTKPAPGREEIAARAHALWEKEGCPEGHDQEHWLAAERELQGAAGKS
jgi:Protein of unknown function (DUF2934)